MILGIIGAMDEEIEIIKNEMEIVGKDTKAQTVFYRGRFQGKNIVLVRCGIGKVNAAIITQILITEYKVDSVINTGVAGAVKDDIQIGDIVVSEDVLEHDFDARSFGYKLGEIPRLKVSKFKADDRLIDLVVNSTKSELKDNRVYKGRIVSGDEFVASAEKKKFLWNQFSAYCVEMEGAAIGHACNINGISFVIIRAISDKADGSANSNYNEFVLDASKKSVNILKRILFKL
ncbi:5'-methylthioadenosine/adenosylhomocysteine nucleosidase [Clostridium sp. D2Q-14]|uniref:5'-methylthioadenosine/adenosylhomocysteine nucleosidase n=1 Tax=Anaeromonas gelatinilytica TaxID=2683194 RepID=UPI00193C258A|nr:5'-methylthioadenosine/adenosylhomocysteine nucleosidase [Anaeromonas gelatinilytica]MBS4534201.1 5'-methylthioadenosine/adenosylhomocysteine nucleosidase [Anaeromonas gelatinilytica]